MAQDFSELPSDLKERLIDRYAGHGMDAEEAYSQHVPIEIRVQGTEAVRAFYADKQISHIYPRSQYPELTSDINNTFLEDSAVNQNRLDKIVTPSEAYEAGQDSIRDAYSGDVNGDGIPDFAPQYDKLAELNASRTSGVSEINAIDSLSDNLVSQSETVVIGEPLADIDLTIAELMESLNKDLMPETWTAATGEPLADIDRTISELMEAMEADLTYGQREAYAAGQDSIRDAYRGDVNGSHVQDFEPQIEEIYRFNSPSMAEASVAESIDGELIAGSGLAEVAAGEVLADSGVTIAELMDADILESAAGGAFTVAFYVGLKTLLAMEGARRRGEVTWIDVAEKTFAEVSKVLPMAMAVSLALGIIVAIFGGWVLIPLMPIAAYYGVKAPIKLVGSYWGGLDDSQKDELRCLARELGGKIQRWIDNLDKNQGEGGIGAS